MKKHLEKVDTSANSFMSQKMTRETITEGGNVREEKKFGSIPLLTKKLKQTLADNSSA